MSINLYHIRLYFDRGRGSAKCGDVEVQLHAPPPIDGLPKHLVFIDFAPQVRCFELRESANGRRDMTREEIEATSKYLAGMESVALERMGLK